MESELGTGGTNMETLRTHAVKLTKAKAITKVRFLSKE
jgi:hypothetical protein